MKVWLWVKIFVRILYNYYFVWVNVFSTLNRLDLDIVCLALCTCCWSNIFESLLLYHLGLKKVSNWLFLFCQKSLPFFLYYYGSKKISHCLFSFFKESFQEVPESVDVLEESITSDDHHVEVEDDNNLKPSLLLSNASSIAETDGDSVVVISPPQTPCSLDTPSPSCLSPVPNEGEIHNMQHLCIWNFWKRSILK